MINIKKKVIFGITSLELGGAERVLVDIVNKICDKYEITIFTIYDNGVLKKELRPEIKYQALYKSKYDELFYFKRKLIPIKILLFSKRIYKKYIEGDYEVEIAFLEGPITRLFSNSSNKTFKIAWIHNDIKRVFGNGLKAFFKKKIDNRIYEKYDKIIFVSNENMKNFQEKYNCNNSHRCSVIYNYINSELVLKKASSEMKVLEQSPEIKLVSVCRLVKQKGIDRFIRVHSRLLKDGIKHKVYIVGDGPEKQYLNRLIRQYNVSDTFILVGKKDNPYPYMNEADYFCLLSYFEGYGMVIEEAKILNKKIIITNTAAREALEGYKYGYIFDNNEEKIYDGLKSVLTDNNEIVKKNKSKYSNEGKIEDIINILEQ